MRIQKRIFFFLNLLAGNRFDAEDPIIGVGRFQEENPIFPEMTFFSQKTLSNKLYYREWSMENFKLPVS